MNAGRIAALTIAFVTTLPALAAAQVTLAIGDRDGAGFTREEGATVPLRPVVSLGGVECQVGELGPTNQYVWNTQNPSNPGNRTIAPPGFIDEQWLNPAVGGGSYNVSLQFVGTCRGTAGVGTLTANRAVTIVNVAPTAKARIVGGANCTSGCNYPGAGTLETYEARSVQFDASSSFDTRLDDVSTRAQIANAQWDRDYDGVQFAADVSGTRVQLQWDLAEQAGREFINVGLRVLDNEQTWSNVLVIPVRVLRLFPEARISAPDTALEGDVVTYDASPSIPPSGFAIVNWEWDPFYSLAAPESILPVAAGITFDNARLDIGVYTMGLRVTDNFPNDVHQRIGWKRVRFENRPPTASFFIQLEQGPPYAANAGDRVFFLSTSRAVPGLIVRTDWDFDYDGDPNNPTLDAFTNDPVDPFSRPDGGANPSFVFPRRGDYVVAVRVTDDDHGRVVDPTLPGDPIIKSQAIAVQRISIAHVPPRACLTLNSPVSTPPVTCLPPGTISMVEGDTLRADARASASVINLPLTYQWDFAYDGVGFRTDACCNPGAPDSCCLSPGAQAFRVYPSTGRFTVAVRVTDTENTTGLALQTLAVTNRLPRLDRLTVVNLDGGTRVRQGDRLQLNAFDAYRQSLPDQITQFEWDLNYSNKPEEFRPDPAYATPIIPDVGTLRFREVGQRRVAVRIRDDDDRPDADPPELSRIVVSTLVTIENRVPVVTSDPPREVDQGTLYRYEPAVVDFDPLTFTLLQGPPGLVQDPSSGVVTWVPGNDDVGRPNLVSFQVTDSYGASSDVQSWSISVRNVNDPPEIANLIGPLDTTSCQRWSATAQGFDPDFGETGLLRYALIQRPDGMMIDEVRGRLTWPEPVVGSWPFAIQVRDPAGATGTASYTLVVRECGDIPSVRIADPPTDIDPGDVQIVATGTNPGAGNLTFTWRAAAEPSAAANPARLLSERISGTDSIAVWRLLAAGQYVLSVTATSDRFSSSPAQAQIFVVNLPPVADLSAVPVLFAGRSGLLDASASRDPNGENLVYRFEPLNLFSTVDGGRVRITGERAGIVLVSLSVSDGVLDGEPDVWPVAVVEERRRPPSLPPDTTVVTTVGTRTRLSNAGVDVNRSTTPTWRWTYLSGPQPGPVMPALPFEFNDFVFDAPGVYRLQADVTDLEGLRAISRVITVIVDAADRSPPRADAGPAIVAAGGGRVRLDGTASFDIDSPRLDYKWRQVRGLPVRLDDDTAARPEFAAVLPGRYRFSLVVSDGEFSSPPAFADVLIHDRDNEPPTPAAAETNVIVGTGADAVLDARPSRDPENAPLRFIWRQVAGPWVALDDPTAARAVFTPPVRPAVYRFELHVGDGSVYALPLSVTVQALDRPANPPIADAGDAQTVNAGATVTLDGSRSRDPDAGDAVAAYAWTADPANPYAVVLTGADSVRAGFVAGAAGVLRFSLVVTDGAGLRSAPATVEITIIDAPGDDAERGDDDPDITPDGGDDTTEPDRNDIDERDETPDEDGGDRDEGGGDVSCPVCNDQNRPPSAAIGPIVLTVAAGRPLTLSCAGSSDPEAVACGDQLAGAVCRWSSTSPFAEFSMPEGRQTTFTAPSPGDYPVRLVVRDACGAEASADGTIRVTDAPPPCVDLDGDTFGDNCPAGPDCNDTDPKVAADCTPAKPPKKKGCGAGSPVPAVLLGVLALLAARRGRRAVTARA